MSKFFEVDNISGVYCITCVQENKRYIKGGKNMWWQFNHHFSHLRAGDHNNAPLQEAYKKYGLTAFTCSILEEIPLKRVAEAEYKWIKQFDPASLYNECRMPQIKRFVDYINNTWLVPGEAGEDLRKKYMIMSDYEKRQIVNMAKECQILDVPKPHTTFIAVMKFMAEELGYEIEAEQILFNTSKITYRLVTGYHPARTLKI